MSSKLGSSWLSRQNPLPRRPLTLFSMALSRVQVLCLAASSVATSAGFIASRNTPAPAKGRDVKFRYEAVLGRSSAWTQNATPRSAADVQNGCERRRKEALRRNDEELARCREARHALPPLNVAWVLSLGGSGTLLGMGLALSAGEAGARRRMWIGGALGFCVAAGGTLALQQIARREIGRANLSSCERMARYTRGEIPDEYTNCLARGLSSISAPSRSR